MMDLPATYGEVAKVILSKICTYGKRIDFVCDTYRSPSIKDNERNMRGANDINIVIAGSEQKRPSNFGQALSSGRFKTSLFKFLAAEWEKNIYKEILDDHEVFLALENVCYKYQVKNGSVFRQLVPELCCQHEEADTRVVFHMNHIKTAKTETYLTVRANDTDILIILLYHIANEENVPNVWMDLGFSKNNSRRYIDVTTLANNLGKAVCCALPALHAFTGCDYTASFLRKGKLRPFEILQTSTEFQNAFSKLGSNEELAQEILNTLESFVCTLYGKSKIESVNIARYALFRQNSAPSSHCHPLVKLKHSDPSLLPPCKSVLTEKIKWANYVSSLWKNAHAATPVQWKAEDSGWELKNGHYVIKWFIGDQLPQEIYNVGRNIDSPEDSDEESTYISDSSNYDSD